MMGVWVLSKSFQAPTGEVLPVAWSYGYNHAAMGYEGNGWGLVWVSLDVHQLTFIKSGTDPNVQFVGLAGRETWSAPPPLLLQTYADKLGADAFDNLGQVLLKLGETEPRFLLERDPRNP